MCHAYKRMEARREIISMSISTGHPAIRARRGGRKKYHADHVADEKKAHRTNHKMHHRRPVSLPLRDVGGAVGSCPLVDIRRCLFIAVAPGEDGPSPTLLTLVIPRPFENPVGTVLVVDARGRVFDDASLGKPVFPLRALPLGAPEARFLQPHNISSTSPTIPKNTKTNRFLITSVFSDSGRTTPCSFCSQLSIKYDQYCTLMTHKE